MKLIFEGQAVKSAGGVNFAAHYDDDTGRRHYVICRTTGEAVRALADGWGAKPSELIVAFRTVQDQIEKLAYAQFASGIARPHITSHDIPRAWLATLRREYKAVQ